MTINSFNGFAFDGDPKDPDYWWEIISLYHQGYDPDADGMVLVPVDQLEELQQAYTKAWNALDDIAKVKTHADIARKCLKTLNGLD